MDTWWESRNYRNCTLRETRITPFYGDQYLNVVALVERGLEFLLPLEEITTERILQTVNKALNPR